LEQIKEEEAVTQNADFWNNPKKAEVLLKKIKEKRQWTSAYKKSSEAYDDLVVLHEFFEMEEASEKEVDDQYSLCLKEVEGLEFLNMLSHEEDKMGAVLQINAGAGGTESNDWAAMLMRMYIRYAERNNFKVKELDVHESDIAGVKSVTLEFEGDFAFGYLKGENGVHRLVRLSPFDSANRRHTSFASVYVYPIVDDDILIEVNSSDITWETVKRRVRKDKTAIKRFVC